MRPTYRIVANNADLAQSIAGRFKSLTVTDAAGYESDTMDLVLADHDPQNPVQLPPTGAELQVWMGYADTGLQRMGLFIADEIEVGGWPGTLSIRARAAPYDASTGGKVDLQSQKTRSWAKGTKLADMVAKIATEHGLKPAVSQSLQSITLPHFDQTDESDVSFLVRVSRKYDAVVKPGGGYLGMAKRGEAKTASGQDMPVVTLTPGQTTRWSMNMSVRDAQGTVVAYYHDFHAGKRVQVQVGAGDPVRRLRVNFPDADSATKAAQGELDKRKRKRNRLDVTLPGNPQLVAEAKLQLQGFRSGLPAGWLITRVVHHIEGNGYICELEAEIPTDEAG